MRRTIATGILAAALAGAAIIPRDLRCDYRKNPDGVESPRPLLSWALDSAERGQRQRAYQVLVASSPEKLAAGAGDLWNSGKVSSGRTVGVPYGGPPLGSGACCFWKVRVWDAAGSPSRWSEPASWSAGILREEEWRARWIGWRPEQRAEDPLPLFRKRFETRGPVARATAFVCGLGFFELRINGKKQGNAVLEPGWTDYTRTALYRVFDVTAALRPGENAVGILLGNGMYNVPGGRYAKFRDSFGPPKLLFHLRLEYRDGSVEVVASGPSWKVAAGPIVFSCIFGGEDYDARREQPGWDAPDFDDSGWRAAAAMDGPGGRLAAQVAPPSGVAAVFHPVRVARPRPGVLVYDLGRNFSGWPVLAVRGQAGATVKMVTGELLDAGGLVTQKSSGGPTSFSYTLKGGGAERWRPRFSYTGFRYVQVEREGRAEVLGLHGEFVHSSAARAGEFRCSSGLFNRIHDLIRAAMLSNLQSVLTDCPHREKLGWLEVAHLLAPSLLFNYDLAAFYRANLANMADAQRADGFVPTTAPNYLGRRSTPEQTARNAFRDSPEWGSAFVILPEMLLGWYGDADSLERHYGGMRRYVDFLRSRTEDGLLFYGLGDWCDIGPGVPGQSKNTPPGITASAIYYQDIGVLERAARLLGKPAEAARYRALGEDVRRRFQERFYDAAAGHYGSGSQTSNAMPLAADLAPPELASALGAKLAADIRARGNHTTAGDVGYRYVILALMAAGRSDVLFDMCSRTDPPSYGNQLERGATTLTEAWDADPRLSQNHCMLGHIEEWFYAGLAGISPDPAGTAFDRIVIRPWPAGGLAWAGARYDSIRGRIESRWNREGGRFTLDVRIPPNTSATVYVPAGSAEEVTEGGGPASRARGVRLLGVRDGAAVFQIQSGAYRFGAPTRSPQVR